MMRVQNFLGRFLIWGGLIILFAGQLAAQEAAGQWISSAAYAFGQSVTFELVGETAVSLAEADLIFQVPGITNPVSVPVPVSEMSDNQLFLQKSITPASLKLAPFVTITYWWELTLVDGSVINVPAQSLFYEDDRLAWQSLDEDGGHVYWTGNDLDLGRVGLQILQDSRRRLETVLTLDEAVPVHLYIYPSSADLRAAFRLNGLDWAGDMTDPPLPVLLVTAVNSRTAATDLQQSIPYALTRFWLSQQTGDHYGDVPLWLREGLAAGMAPGGKVTMEGVLETAVNNQSTISFTQLCHDFPTSGIHSATAVAQSVDFVQYLQTQFGSQTVQDLVNVYADGQDCLIGVNHVVGKSLSMLNQDWLQTVRSYPLIVQFMIDNGVWFLLILFMIFIMGFLVWKI